MVRAETLADILVVYEHGAGFGAEALALAVGTGGVAAVLREEDADVELVLLAVELGEEAADAGEGAFAVFDEGLLGGSEVEPRDVNGDACGGGGALHLAMVRAVFCRRPGGNCAFVEGLRFVGNDEVGVEVDGVAKTLAARAGAERDC